MAIGMNDLKTGLTIEYNNSIWRVLEFQHVKPGKGAAFVRSKLKNLRTGAVNEVTFRPGDKFEQAEITTRPMQYLYADGDSRVFMDTETYDQVSIPDDHIKDALKFLLENAEAVIRQNFMLQARLKVMEKTLVEKEKAKQEFEQNLSNTDTEKESLRSTVDRLNAQIAELSNKVDASRKENDNLNNQIADWQNKANSFQSDAVIEKQRIQQAYNESQKTITNLTAEKDSLNAVVQDLMSQVESLKASQIVVEETKTTKRKPKSEVVIDEMGGSSKINTTTSTRTEFGGTF